MSEMRGHNEQSQLDIRLTDIIAKLWNLSEDYQFDDEIRPGMLDEWDSMGMIQLIEAVEQEFNIHFDVEDILAIENLGSIKKIIAKHLTANNQQRTKQDEKNIINN